MEPDLNGRVFFFPQVRAASDPIADHFPLIFTSAFGPVEYPGTAGSAFIGVGFSITTTNGVVLRGTNGIFPNPIRIKTFLVNGG